MDEFKAEIDILKKVFPILLEKPDIMRGCDISQSEIDDILENKTLSLSVLENVAGDNFFQTYNEEIGLTIEEAREISEFLYKTAKYYKKDLKKEFPFLKK